MISDRSFPDPSRSPRRRTPPYDARRVAPSGPGIQIRGRARDVRGHPEPRDGLDYRDERRDERMDDYEDERRDERRDNFRGDRPEYLTDDRRESSRDRYDDRSRYRTEHDWRERSPRHHSRDPIRSRSPAPSRGYYDRDRPNARSGTSRSHPPLRQPGQPTNEVVLDGFPPQMTRQDIKEELRDAYRTPPQLDIRIIRDEKTGDSKGFGILEFPSVDAAREFVDRNYPKIHLYGPRNKRATSVEIDFGRRRERAAPIAEWECKECYTVNPPRRRKCVGCDLMKEDSRNQDYSDGDESLEPPKTGDLDAIDAVPSQFLLFRSLKQNVTEATLAKGAEKLLKTDEDPPASEGATANKASIMPTSTSTPTQIGARPGSIRRILLVRSRKTEQSWGYGFVEFATLEDAQSALAKFNKMDQLTISSEPVEVSNIHLGVFTPVLQRKSADYSFPASNQQNLRLAYWDATSYVTVLDVSTPETQQLAFANNTVSTDNKRDAPDQSTKKSEGKTKNRKTDGGTKGSATTHVAPHLQVWASKHNELHGIENSPAPPASGKSISADNGKVRAEMPTKPSPSKPLLSAEPAQQSYGHPDKMCCYLCSRQFKSGAQLNLHERRSDLHKTNLQNPKLTANAKAKLEAEGVAHTLVSAAQPHPDAKSEYRDRAKERRQAFNQPKQPASASASTFAATQPPSNPALAATTAAATDDSDAGSGSGKSKGAALLASMGYTAGRGLGAHGTGIAAPIATDMYAAGVGLGAEGGKLGDAAEAAGRATRGDAGEFVEATRERARERFERLDK